MWADDNGNGIMDDDEVGVEGVDIELYYYRSWKMRVPRAAGSREFLTTDAEGDVIFSGVPRMNTIFAKVRNMPPFVSYTGMNVGGDRLKDSDAKANGLTSFVHIANFQGLIFEELSIGFRYPSDVKIRVWNDANENGIQDPDEFGISGVEIQLFRASGSFWIPISGKEDSTDDEGIVTFYNISKAYTIAAKVLNVPDGTKVTRKGASVGGVQNHSVDSDLDGHTMMTNAYKMASFTSPGAMGEVCTKQRWDIWTTSAHTKVFDGSVGYWFCHAKEFGGSSVV